MTQEEAELKANAIIDIITNLDGAVSDGFQFYSDWYDVDSHDKSETKSEIIKVLTNQLKQK